MRSANAIGNELDQLAREPAYQNLAGTLVPLADSLKSGDLTPWAKVDLLQLCDAESVLPDSGPPSSRRRLAHLDLVRNFLLFLPLLFTWGGIYAAVRAYRELLNAPTAEQNEFKDASFLQMWTRGFGDRTWVTLDLVALLDFFAILAVILLFVGGGWLHRRAAFADEARRRERIVQLRSLLTEATVTMAVDSDDTSERITNGMKDLLTTYQTTLRQLVVAQKDLAACIYNGKQNVSELVRATGDLARTGNVIASSAGGLKRHMAALAESTKNFDSTTSSLVASAKEMNTRLPVLEQTLHELLDNVQNLSEELHAVHRHQIDNAKSLLPIYQATLDQLHSAQTTLADSVVSGRQNVSELATTTSDLAKTGRLIAGSADGLKLHVASLTESSKNYDNTISSLVASANNMNIRLPSLKQDLLDVLANVRQVGGKLDELYARQEVIAEELGVLADNPLAAAEAAKRTAEIARKTEEALLKTVNALPQQMDRLRGEVIAALDREILERHAAARALKDAGEAARIMALSAQESIRKQTESSARMMSGLEQRLSTTLGSLTTTSLEATNALRQAIDLLRDSSSHYSGRKMRRGRWRLWSRSSRRDG